MRGNLENLARALDLIKLGYGHMRHVKQRFAISEVIAVEPVVEFAQAITAVGDANENRRGGWYERLNIAEFDFKGLDLGTKSAQTIERLLLGSAKWAWRQDGNMRRKMRMLGVKFCAEVFHELAQIALDVRNKSVQIR